MKVLKCISATLCVSMLLSGCAALKSGLPEYDEKTYDIAVNEATADIVERKASEEKVIPELTDDFVQKYLDMNSFAELQARTKAGIAITNKTADMTKDEIKLWNEVIANKTFTMYTVDDLRKKEAELNTILDQLAAGANGSIEDFLWQMEINMTEQQAKQFLSDQADLYVAPNEN